MPGGGRWAQPCGSRSRAAGLKLQVSGPHTVFVLLIFVTLAIKIETR